LDSSAESPITRLAQLQALDRQLREKTELRQTLEAELAALESQLLAQREATRAAQAERDTLDTRRRELEAQLESEGAKMTDRRMRLNRVRNEKELQALRREIEVGKEANQQLEEAVLYTLESLDTVSAAAGVAESCLAELEAAVRQKDSDCRIRIEQLTAEVSRERHHRDQIAALLDTDLRQKYEQIFERRGGSAVVEVRNGTCQGCYMHLPPQFFNELQRTRDVRLCPNCHRILFWCPEPLEPAEPSR